MSLRQIFMAALIAAGCTSDEEGPAREAPAVSTDDLVVALSDIHRRPELAELRAAVGEGVVSALVRIANDPHQNWLARTRALEVLASSSDPAARRTVQRFLRDEGTPASIRRSVGRIWRAKAAKDSPR